MATYRILRLFDVTATQRVEMEFPDDAAALAYMATLTAHEIAGTPHGNFELEHSRIEIEDDAEQSRVRFWLDRMEAGQIENEIEYFDCPQAHERVEYAARDLLASLRAILPYAESRAEDMGDCADALAEDAENFDIDDKAGLAKVRAERDEARAYADKAVAAVDAAKALLASLDAA